MGSDGCPFILTASRFTPENLRRNFDNMFWVYILQNPHGKFYVGQTENLVARLEDHNRTDCFDGHFTRKNGPWRLVWSEMHESRSSAVGRERQIKQMKSAVWIRKNLLATAVNTDASGF